MNGSDGTTRGYVDLETNAVVPKDERYRQAIIDAVARYLRQG